MSTRATSGGDVASVDTSAVNDRQLNEVRRLGVFAYVASPDYLHSEEIVYFIDYALVTGNPTKQGFLGG